MIHYTTLIGAYVSSRSPRSVTLTDKLQRVLNAAARVITNTKKLAGNHGYCITTFTGWMLLNEVNGFSPEWLQQYYQYLHGMAPAYLTELTPVTASASRRGGLRSVTTSNLVVPCCRHGTRAFSVAGPVCWNALTPLPDYLKSSDLSFDVSKHQLKTFLFCRYRH